MAVTLRYLIEFGKRTFQHMPPRRSVAEFMHEFIVFCSTCTMSSYRKFTFAISSPDEFLVITPYYSTVYHIGRCFMQFAIFFKLMFLSSVYRKSVLKLHRHFRLVYYIFAKDIVCNCNYAAGTLLTIGQVRCSYLFLCLKTAYGKYFSIVGVAV